MIRKALAEDLDAVDALYDKVHSAEKSGTVNTGWVRGVYPGRDTAAVAVEAGVALFFAKMVNNDRTDVL